MDQKIIQEEKLCEEIKQLIKTFHLPINIQQNQDEIIEEFRSSYINKIGITCFSMSTEFMREFKDSLNWHDVSFYQILSEDVIEEFKDYVDWAYISRRQKLSNEFILRFKDKLDWDIVCCHQKLSEDTIRQCRDKVLWAFIYYNQTLTKEFISEFSDKFLPYIEEEYEEVISE